MPNGFSLITGSRAATAVHMRRLMVRLAVRGPVRWLACGHFFDLQGLIYEAAQRAGGDYHAIIRDRIAICRAETCYQVLALLRKTASAGGPVFISDLLMHFHDENVRPEEAARIFNEALPALQHLSRRALVVVTAAPAAPRPQFFALLRRDAARVVTLTEVPDGT